MEEQFHEIEYEERSRKEVWHRNCTWDSKRALFLSFQVTSSGVQGVIEASSTQTTEYKQILLYSDLKSAFTGDDLTWALVSSKSTNHTSSITISWSTF